MAAAFELQIFDDSDSDSQIQPVNSEIERLQNHVLDELASLNDRICGVFKAFGYRDVDAADESLPSIS